jgi:hypothetical protein
MKKSKPVNRSKPKKPSKEDVLTARAVLEAMCKSKKQVQVMIIINPLFLKLESTIQKQLDWYVFEFTDVDIHLVPELCDLIMFHKDGGLLMSHKDVTVLVDLKESSTEGLLALYPEISSLIH